MTDQPIEQRVPRARGQLARTAIRGIQAALLAGNEVACPCCGRTFRRFLAYGDPPRASVRCPVCGSLERHRAIWLYLTGPSGVLDRPCEVLDVAPAPFLGDLLARRPGVKYLSIDLASPVAMRQMDVTRLDLPDATYDLVLCSHVLEHVPDDRAAMRELLRVLRPGGMAILQTPWAPDESATDEDATIADAHERERRFGQADHVRRYGRDLLERLAEAGWSIELIDVVSAFGSHAVARHRLATDDPIMLGRHPA